MGYLADNRVTGKNYWNIRKYAGSISGHMEMGKITFYKVFQKSIFEAREF